MSELFNESTRSLMVAIYGWYVFVPVLVGLIFFKKLNKPQVLIFYITLLSGLNHLASKIVRSVATDHNNAWVFHVYVPLIFWLTWRLYKAELEKIFFRGFFNLLLGVCFSFFIVNSLFIQDLKTVPSNGIFVISGVFIMFGFSYFYSLLKQTQFKSLEKEPVFWFTSGVIMYYSSTILIFLLVFSNLEVSYRSLEEEKLATVIVSILNVFFNLVLVTSYLIALWVKPPRLVLNNFS
ncbi:hypothetical protein AWW68_08880 [Roseivirga spongicola]|uniref:Uncharacterized protein n=1 Tax=Roseivirga spongicola TaxID=333140 RepID=A0A150XB43_9BACT|nr:hypothetical protein AWW68_08880 [Roseivirga spongicola]